MIQDNNTSSERVFNEITLQQEIEKVWGKHGAHAEVYRDILKLLSSRSEQVDNSREDLGAEASGSDLSSVSTIRSSSGNSVEQNELLKAFEQGEFLELDNPLSPKEKEALVNAVINAVSKSLMWLFYQSQLNNGFESMLINDADGKEFILSFKTLEEWKKHTSMLNSDRDAQVSDTTTKHQGTEPSQPKPSTAPTQIEEVPMYEGETAIEKVLDFLHGEATAYMNPGNLCNHVLSYNISSYLLNDVIPEVQRINQGTGTQTERSNDAQSEIKTPATNTLPCSEQMQGEDTKTKILKSKTMIPKQIENPNGLHQRYHIEKIDSKGWTRPVDPDSEYFVMRLDTGGSDIEHIKACRIGIHAYADAIEHHIPELARDLRERYPLL